MNTLLSRIVQLMELPMVQQRSARIVSGALNLTCGTHTLRGCHPSYFIDTQASKAQHHEGPAPCPTLPIPSTAGF